MIQSGILTTIDSTTGQSTGVPVRGAWINFVQDNVTKATVQTNIETGAYSVDVPLGKYTVKIAVGDVTGIQRAGQLFELKTGDKADAFQKWFYGETGSIDDDLLKQFKQISNDINASANRAENAEKGAKQIEINMQNNSIGNANGAWLKVGASKSDFLKTFGIYYSSDIMPYLVAGDTGLSYAKHFKTKNTGLDFTNTGINENEFLYYEVQKNYNDASSGIIEFKGYRGRAIYAQSYKRSDGTWGRPVIFYNQENAKADKNNVLHATIGTPKDTLLVGDNGIGVNNLPIIRSSELNSPNNLSTVFFSSVEFPVGQTAFGGSIAGVLLKRGGNATQFLYSNISERVGVTTYLDGAYRSHCEFYTTKNTTVDSNGNIKKASPIIKLFHDRIEWNQDFKEDPVFEKLAVGIYKISNTYDLAREGWTHEKPRGKDGNTYFKIKVQKLDDGCIISVHDYFVDHEDVTIIDDVGNKQTVKKQIEVLSQARDIKPEERWIDLRFFEKIYD